MTESNDGFYITEKDFEMRGEGDLFGVKQSGDMSFKVANIKQDYKILLQVRDDVKEFIKSKDYLNYDCYKEFIHSLENVD
jgi:ATP-dependent DNA helicase RecG